jgi:hypothetical protein
VIHYSHDTCQRIQGHEASGKGHALSSLEITMAPGSARESERRLHGLHTARTAADDDSHLTIKIGMVELGLMNYRVAECLFLCDLPGGLCIMRLFWAPAVGAASSPRLSFSVGTSRPCGRSSVTETSTLGVIILLFLFTLLTPSPSFVTFGHARKADHLWFATSTDSDDDTSKFPSEPSLTIHFALEDELPSVRRTEVTCVCTETNRPSLGHGYITPANLGVHLDACGTRACILSSFCRFLREFHGSKSSHAIRGLGWKR